MDRETQLLTAREVAILFGVSFKTVTRWATEGKVPYIRTPGGHYRYPKDLIDQLLQKELGE